MEIAGGPSVSDFDAAPVDRSERRNVAMRGYVILDDGSHHDIRLLDLSYEGCGIETTLDLDPGTIVRLSVLRRGAIESEVRWCRSGKAGLAFVPPAPEAKPYWPRRSERISLAADLNLRRIGKSTFQVAVADASPEGCRVELVERPAVGERVLVKFSGLEPLEAEVSWIEGHTAGLRYLRPMHPAVFELLVERLTG
ncbi:MAG TPA: PilZ domain-containing protein [Sphingomicrobium sp.]|nr:PilZ domain-containing protein [Sphingomicrobium sp.]